MSLRVLACFLFVIGFSLYAWRNWFASLCAAILLMAVIEHPDMPKSIAGIQGLNPWNILMGNVLLAWAVRRRQEWVAWDLPPGFGWRLLAYLLILTIACLRLLLDRGRYEAEYSTAYVFSEYFVNCFKWILPGLLLYDGCRSYWRVEVSIAAILGLYVLLAVQVIRWMPLDFATGSGDDFAQRGSKIIENEIGYNRVTLSNMLGGASWAVFSAYVLFRVRRYRLGILGLAGVVGLGQALTGGRTGYASWAFVGCVLCLLRWRWMLPVGAALGVGLLALLPGVRERLLQGFGGNRGNVAIQQDDYEITSGRNIAWPLVVKQIGEDPLFGFGREAMVITGIRDHLMEEYDESFPHPHNAYLQLLLDSGIIGFLPVMAFYGFVLRRGLSLLLDRSDPLYTAVGGMASALVLALLVGSLGGQTFYPREGAVGMWATMFLMVRVSVERQRSRATGLPLFSEEAEEGEVILLEDHESLQAV